MLAVALLLAGSVLGCTQHDIVTIKYEQIGACNGIDNGQTVTSAGPNAAYVIFRIHSVDNTDTNPRFFQFEPDRLFLNGRGSAHANSKLNLTALNPFYAVPVPVNAGQSVAINGAVVAIADTSDPDGAREASRTKYDLLYQGAAGGQGMNLVKGDPTRAEWPYIPDCSNIIY
jgi:hypothetical protein